MMKQSVLMVMASVLIFSLFSCAGASGTAAPDPVILESVSGDYQVIRNGEYQLQNNVWGKKELTGYKQSVFLHGSKGSPAMGWEWNWPAANRVLAYPEILYGYGPWNGFSTTDKLPARVTESDLTINYSYTMKSSGTHNVAFDLWVTSGDTPTPQTLTDEIMIWVGNKGMVPAGSRIAAPVIGGVRWEFWVNTNHDPGEGGVSGWDYLAFVSPREIPEGSLPIGEFLAYLVDKGYVDSSCWLASIELGTEIVGGRGKILFDRYEITGR